jgi:hypothetical protein
MAAAISPKAPPAEATAEVSPSETTAAKSASVAFFRRAKYERSDYDASGRDYGELFDHSLPPQT